MSRRSSADGIDIGSLDPIPMVAVTVLVAGLAVVGPTVPTVGELAVGILAGTALAVAIVAVASAVEGSE